MELDHLTVGLDHLPLDHLPWSLPGQVKSSQVRSSPGQVGRSNAQKPYYITVKWSVKPKLA